MFLCGASLLALGCNGSGQIQFASLSYRSIDPPNAAVAEVEARECYWWEDDDGRVWVAMQRHFSPPFHPEFYVHIELSLVVDRLPRGKARNYRLNRDSLRARVRIGPWETRFSSQIGVAAVYRERGDRLRGSVRLQTQRVTSQLFSGWGRPQRYLMLVSFEAVPDAQRGLPIVASSESSGWERKSAGAAAPKAGDDESTAEMPPTADGVEPETPESDK